MHRHGPARAERVCSNVFWGKSESVPVHSAGLSPNDRDNVWDADCVEPLSGRLVDDWGSGVASVCLLAEKDVDACSDWIG